jgi:signal transduction histidine kinase
MCVAAAACAAYRYRMAQVLAIANLRTRIATDLHDDIGSNLTKIAILSEVARRQLGREEAASDGDSLSAIARISRESVSSMSDIVWAINPQRDHLLDLVRRMRQHAEQVFTTRGIRLTFRAPSEEQDIRLRADIRRDVFLIFKEAVNNAARHARCSEVEIDFRIADGRLSLSVCDDGGGFDPTQMSNGEGLASMRRRAERLGGACEVSSDNGKNTVVHVTIGKSANAHLRK